MRQLSEYLKSKSHNPCIQWHLEKTKPNYKQNIHILSSRIFFFIKILFIFRERGREGEKGRETLIAGLNWGPDLPPMHMP